jgi:hypothetical protein
MGDEATAAESDGRSSISAKSFDVQRMIGMVLAAR